MRAHKDIERHFSQLAPQYTKVRTTDKAPVLFIQETLQSFPEITAAHLGCGAGRYDVLFLRHFKGRMKLICVDSNPAMLNQLVNYLTRRRAEGYHPIRSSAEQLPLASRSMDCLFSFNSIHWFRIRELLREASRVLRKDGYFFIYTRFRGQNERTIWGRWFPLFAKKEERLYELGELEAILGEYPDLLPGPIRYFQYKRSATLPQLVRRARNFHYSTFRFYSEEEFDRALRQFQDNIRAHFDPRRVHWQDENVMLVVRKREEMNKKRQEARKPPMK